jgi:TusA-related sulfurtransferase
MQPFIQGLKVDASVDLRGIEPPACYQQAREMLARMPEEHVLELHVDEGDVLRSLPYGLRADGHEILVSEPTTQGIRMLVRKRSLPDATQGS